MVFSVSFSPDGKTVVSGELRQHSAVVGCSNWCSWLGKPLNGHEDTIFSVSFSPDGKNIDYWK